MKATTATKTAPPASLKRVVGHTSNTMKTGIQLIAAERKRQVTEERWSGEHDDKHRRKELASAAESYLSTHTHPDEDGDNQGTQAPCWDWPWARKWWKPSADPVRNLVKAGALIAAEIDRLQRKAARKASVPNDKLRDGATERRPSSQET